MKAFIEGQSVIVLREDGPKMYTVKHISRPINSTMTLSFMDGPELLLNTSGKNAYNKQEVFHMTKENCHAINTLYNLEFSPDEEYEVVVTMTLKKTVRIFASNRNAARMQAERMNEDGILNLCVHEDFDDIYYD